jgi:hypothetical protein
VDEIEGTAGDGDGVRPRAKDLHLVSPFCAERSFAGREDLAAGSYRLPGIRYPKHLHRLEVAAAIRRRPDAQYVVAQNGSRVTLEEAGGA